MTYREPDIIVYLTEHRDRFGERYGEGADLVVEAVCDDAASRARDYDHKRRGYAEAGIPEYWIVDPVDRRILVLRRQGNQDIVSGEFEIGDEAQSEVLGGFRVNAARVLQAGEE